MVSHYLDNPPTNRRQDAISGLVGYYYKDISAQIPFDETTFALPPWLRLDADEDQLIQAEELLGEHWNLVWGGLREKHADHLAILSHYRHFIARGDPDDWIAFAIAYSTHRFKKLKEEFWRPSLRVPTLEETLMNNQFRDYSPILTNLGFINITDAIRYCTVTLRYLKDVEKQDIPFKVRHGLGDDLRRHAHDPDQFVIDLTEFVHDYARESANVQASSTPAKRKVIDKDDLAELILLLNDYPSEVVANLLVAIGYAAKSRKKQVSKENMP